MPEAGRKVSNDLGKQMSDDQGKQKHCGVLRFFVLFCLFILFFISSLQRKLHKKKNKTQTKSMLETKSHSELRSMEVPSSCGCRENGSVVPL